jgi:MFS family permease
MAMPGTASRRHAAALTAGLFIVAYGTNVSTPFLLLYKERLGLSPSQTMAIFAAYVAGILATLMVAGPLSDRFGRRPVVLPMVALSGVASLAMVLGRNDFALLLAGRCLLGVVSGGVLGVGAAWLFELLGPGQEQRAAVTTTVVTFTGFGIGPLVSALFFWVLPAPLVVPFVVHAVATGIVVIFMLAIPETHPASPGTPIRVSLGIPPRARRSFWIVVAPAAIWVFAFPSTSFALFPVLVSDALDGGEVAVAGAAGTLTAWAGLSSRPLVNRVGPRAALPVGMILGFGGYLVGTISFATNIWPLVLIAAPLLGGAAGAITAGCLALLGTMADDRQRGAVTSSFYLLAYPGMTMPVLITTLAVASSMSFALTTVTFVSAVFAVGVVAVARSGTGSVVGT